jgi:hypothetical protein
LNSSSRSWIRNPRTTIADDKIPCFTAFIREAAFPSTVLGPVDFRAFLRFAAILLTDNGAEELSFVSGAKTASVVCFIDPAMGATSGMFMAESILSSLSSMALAKEGCLLRRRKRLAPTQPPLLPVREHARTIPLSEYDV